MNPAAVLLVVAGGAYAFGASRRRGRKLAGASTSFFLAVAAATIALCSPLDGAALRSLPAHMVQHVLLLSVVAPLAVAGAPLEVLPWALPPRWRRRVQRTARLFSRAVAGDRWWAAAGVAIAVQALALFGWHAPGPYQAALRHEPVHDAEHLSLLVAGLLLWWVLLGGPQRRPRAGSVLVLFAATLPSTALGVAMVVARTPWYPAYGHGLGGQQVAGAVMWGVAGSLAVVQGAVLFGWWLATTPDDSTVLVDVSARMRS